jgi:hypothetical protein
MLQTPLSYSASYTIDVNIDRAAVTNYGGLFPYLDLMLLTDLPGIIRRALPPAPATGWQPAEYVASLLALNLTGGDCVDDVAKLADDPGLALYMGQIRHALGITTRRMARGGTGVLPSLTSHREWLETFHHAEEEAKRQPGVAFIPPRTAALAGLRAAGRQFVTAAFRLHQRSGRSAITRATLEIDATYMETQKLAAVACYKKYDAYSALCVRWQETGLVLWDEFRDGNVPPAYRNQAALMDAITYLNTELGLTDVWVRSDAAAFQQDLLKMLATWEIAGQPCPVRFAIGYKKTDAFRAVVRTQAAAEWTPVRDQHGKLLSEVTEVVFVSNREALVKAEPYRHVVVRRQVPQGMLPGLEVSQPGHAEEETVAMGGKAYKIFAIVSNIPAWTPQAIVEWDNGRCGGGEAVNSVLKSDLAGGQLPSNKFGANAAWWAVVVLAHNLHALLDCLALPGDLKGARFKRLRFQFINVPARLVQHARQCVVRYFTAGALAVIEAIRAALRALQPL